MTCNVGSCERYLLNIEVCMYIVANWRLFLLRGALNPTFLLLFPPHPSHGDIAPRPSKFHFLNPGSSCEVLVFFFKSGFHFTSKKLRKIPQYVLEDYKNILLLFFTFYFCTCLANKILYWREKSIFFFIHLFSWF